MFPATAPRSASVKRLLPSRCPPGELNSEQALPLEPNSHSYSAHYAWGDVTIGSTFAFDANDAIVGLLFQPDWPLPPDPAAGSVPSATYHLPFEGVWWVLWGGDTLPENYHAISRLSATLTTS